MFVLTCVRLRSFNALGAVPPVGNMTVRTSLVNHPAPEKCRNGAPRWIRVVSPRETVVLHVSCGWGCLVSLSTLINPNIRHSRLALQTAMTFSS